MHTTLTDAVIGQSILTSFAAGHGTLVRKAAGREVYRLDLSGQDTFYVKSFPISGNLIKNAIILFKVWYEYYYHVRLIGKKVPLPDVVGWARITMDKGNDVAVLVTRGVHQSQPLQQFDGWSDEVSCGRFFKIMAGFLAANYSKGILHSDLHLGNILFDKPNNRLLFVDPKEISVCRKLSTRKMLANLSTLYCSFYPEKSFSEDVWNRFLKNFYEQYGLTLPYDSFLKIMDRFRRKRIALWIRKRTRRCFRDNLDFIRFHDGNMRGVRKNFYTFFKQIDSQQSFCHFVEGKFSSAQSTYLKDSNTTEVLKTQENGCQTVIKKFKVKRLFDPLKNLLRRSRGYRSWYWGWCLTLHKIPTPEPLFFAEKRRNGLLYESYYAMRYTENTHTAAEFLNKYGNTLSWNERRSFVRQLAQLCRALIEAGINHHDFQLKNILVEYIDGAEARSFRLYVIDLEAIGRKRRAQKPVALDYLRQLRKSYLRLQNNYFFRTGEILLFLRLVLGKNFEKNTVEKFFKVREV